jgi:hypothetical protein
MRNFLFLRAHLLAPQVAVLTTWQSVADGGGTGSESNGTVVMIRRDLWLY